MTALLPGRRWINLHATGRCNLRCTYCYERTHSNLEPRYDLGLLRELVSSVAGPVTVCFYGGEPTLNPAFMAAVMQRLEGTGARYGIQSNGTVIGQLDPELLGRFEYVAISIDGPEAVTDAVRGQGTYNRVLASLEQARPHLRVAPMARMTLTEVNDLAPDVDALMEHFDAVYWQLDNDLGGRDHGDFTARYRAGLPALIDRWEARAATGRIVNLVPLVGVFHALFRARQPAVPYYYCSPGRGAVTIDTEGRIFSCPEGTARGDGCDHMGSLHDALPFPLRQHPPRPECSACEDHRICGGRCIWTSGEPYCSCTRALIQAVKANAARMRRHISAHRLDAWLDLILSTEVIP